MIFNNNETLATGYELGTPRPQDSKGWFSNLDELKAVTSSDIFTFYTNMHAIDVSTGLKYVWKESATGVMDSSFTYPPGFTSHGVNYSDKIYNFVPVGNSVIFVGINEVFPIDYDYLLGTIALVITGNQLFDVDAKDPFEKKKLTIHEYSNVGGVIKWREQGNFLLSRTVGDFEKFKTCDIVLSRGFVNTTTGIDEGLDVLLAEIIQKIESLGNQVLALEQAVNEIPTVETGDEEQG